MYLRSIVFCWVKNDWYGGLRQPTANFDSTLPFIQTQKAKPLWNSEITDLSLFFCRYRMEFCWPQRSKKYRCLCVCAKTAFAISTPVSFLYSFSFFHLVAWKRQGAAPMAERYFAFPRILFPKDTSGSPPVTVFGETKKRLRYALRHSTAAWGRAYKNRFVKTALDVEFCLCTWLLGASPCFHNYLAVFGICWYQCIRCRGKSEECISVIYTVYMESGKKLLGYDREIACFSKTVVKERNTAQRFLCPLCRNCDVSVMDR